MANGCRTDGDVGVRRRGDPGLNCSGSFFSPCFSLFFLNTG
jgi:hypothetical protein